MANERTLDFDELQMYFGEPYKINDDITISQPTIGNILTFGEQKFYRSLAPFTSNTTTYRLQLWDMGIDWNDISDYELFIMLVQGLKPEDTKLLFGDLDFSKFSPQYDTQLETIVLVDFEKGIIIDEWIYTQMSEYLRLMFNQYPKVEYAKTKSTKEAIIDEERMNQRIAAQKKNNKQSKSMLLPLVSAMLNHPGFKYKKNELKEVGIVEFMDSVQRLQVYESTRALMSGMYSGMLDCSKINMKEELNWLRDLHNG